MIINLGDQSQYKALLNNDYLKWIEFLKSHLRDRLRNNCSKHLLSNNFNSHGYLHKQL